MGTEATRGEAGEARLTAEELASAVDATPERVRALVAAGVLRPAADGTFSTGDELRITVADAMEEAGLSLEVLRRGIEEGIVSFEQTDQIYPDPGPLGGTVTALADELQLGTDDLLRIITAFGLPRPDPATRLHRPDEEMLRGFVHAWRAVGDTEVLVRAARSYGDALRRAAEGWLGLYEEVVLGPLADRVLSWEEMSRRAVEPGFRILEVGRAMLPWLLDQHRAQVLNRLNFDSIERQLAMLGVVAAAPRDPSAIVFADLAGYTRLTEEEGDEVAAASATRLAELANEVAQAHGGRLVKLLGDGVMLQFGRAADAVPAAASLRTAVAAAGLPPTHTGIDAGAVIRRQSDYFGRTVNIASRLAGQAGPGEILVTEALVEAAGWADGTAAPTQLLERLEPLELKGIPQPVTAFRVRA